MHELEIIFLSKEFISIKNFSLSEKDWIYCKKLLKVIRYWNNFNWVKDKHLYLFM